jgi:hypothetical protein
MFGSVAAPALDAPGMTDIETPPDLFGNECERMCGV